MWSAEGHLLKLAWALLYFITYIHHINLTFRPIVRGVVPLSDADENGNIRNDQTKTKGGVEDFIHRRDIRCVCPRKGNLPEHFSFIGARMLAINLVFLCSSVALKNA